MNPWALTWSRHARRTPFPSIPQDVRTVLATEETGPWVWSEAVTEQLLLLRVHRANSLLSKTSHLCLFWAAGSGASICSRQLAQVPRSVLGSWLRDHWSGHGYHSREAGAGPETQVEWNLRSREIIRQQDVFTHIRGEFYFLGPELAHACAVQRANQSGPCSGHRGMDPSPVEGKPLTRQEPSLPGWEQKKYWGTPWTPREAENWYLNGLSENILLEPSSQYCPGFFKREDPWTPLYWCIFSRNRNYLGQN